MTDKNECQFTGAVEGFTVVATKSGISMVRFFLLAGKEKISVVAFRDLADQTRLAAGDRVAVLGAIQSTSWDGRDGVRRYGFQIIAAEITAESEAPAPPPPPPGDHRKAPMQPYQGGPF
jgi:single-stranded DNA-binding protein